MACVDHLCQIDVGKKTAGPARRAVEYLKGTWRRVTRSPRRTAVQLNISSPFPPRRRSGACMDRTQLNDVVDDDDLTIVPSNVSYGASSINSASSPKIQDCDWRHFTETGIKSSPSTFLGPWSSQLDGAGRGAKNKSSDCLTIDSTQTTWIKGNTSELEIISDYFATRPNTPKVHPHKDSAVWLKHRSLELPSTAPITTPTPAERSTAHMARRVSDSVLSTAADLDKLLEGARKDDEPIRRYITRADTSDRWSFVSIRGESTTNDLIQDDMADLPASKRRKISTVQSPPQTPAVKAETQPERAKTTRNHPRYSGTYTLDPRRRVMNFPHGPAVFMSSSPAVKV
ncbi:hypothetical protein JX265_005438 [Neoarthrinium moseri]|uniref:Uncharacterized protein n=1 Tax=Neoarthrinium moseri TaxID=1658444 RepID=A0A9P9WNR0_9PEZI|nr:uncharacterized protein JN550_009343 [Neoarthrinium moseri]KAI1845282.1 hypothetical protein JX266_008592 [Neoarthrinium moseri]KAI1863845.1 hypothetical protein JN550_009343 [Neoarthrinium moseri]KAI1872558.1 hypothetical protein JX265_005438 [Neoarthrinium moseri]